MNSKYVKKLFEKGKALQERKESQLSVLKKKIIDLESVSGNLNQLSKQAINEAVQGRLLSAKSKIKDGEKIILDFKKATLSLRGTIIKNIETGLLLLKDLQHIKLDQLEDNFEKTKEEFLEAKILTIFFDKKTIYQPNKNSDLDNFNTYVGALSDFCGELVRKARLEIIANDNTSKLQQYKKTTQSVYESLSGFAFSNLSGNRTKLEQLKSFIDRFEIFAYDMKIRGDRNSKK